MSLYDQISGPNDHQTNSNPQWENEGVLLLRQFIPNGLIDAYVEERTRLLAGGPKYRSGWNDPVPYLRVPQMKELALFRPLTEAIRPLILGQEPGLHLCLTGFESTERAWHCDSYLNPETVGERYIAAWIACGQISPDAGPFEYVPGSHKWPVIKREKVWAEMRARGQDPSKPTWPSDSQGWVGEACAQEIEKRGVVTHQFLAEKGDVLLWHASLIHRGSLPKDRNLIRPALIAHYSGVDARPDMPNKVKIENGSTFFDFAHGYTEPERSTHKSQQ